MDRRHRHLSLEARRVVVRTLEPDDLAVMVEAWTADDVPGFMDDFGPRTPAEVAAWLPEAIAAHDADPAYGGCAIVERSSGEVVGWIGWGTSNPRHVHVGDVDFAYVVAKAGLQPIGEVDGEPAFRSVRSSRS